MKPKDRAHSGNSIPRMAFVALSHLFQVGWLMLLVLKLNAYSAWISLATGILSFLAVLRLYSRHTTSSVKMSWMLLIMAFPVMGLSLYLMVMLLDNGGSMKKRIRRLRQPLRARLRQPLRARLRQPLRARLGQSREPVRALAEEDRSLANLSGYLEARGGYPLWGGTQARYFPGGAQALEAMKADLEQAERFIFMEYFIVSEDSAFRELREILVRKAKEGVEVRFLYDDVGSVGYVNLLFAKKLNADGIRCIPFNPAVPVLNLFMNHRDHRKITVIDGKVGYTGGYNLADEYFDRSFPFGKWKDTGLRLEGEGVRSLTAAFLEMWGASARKEEDPGPYLAPAVPCPEARGFVQPFGDDPLGKERLAENVYLNLLARAKDRVWFCTPYLIITDEMTSALALAAKRGVDVRIITPGIPDKKVVYAVTRSYYVGLAANGVRIFEWSPGFCHAKQCVCDGEAAMLGTSNLDYRSLYLHFENNVVLYGCDAVADMEADMAEMLHQCREVTEQYRTGRTAILRTWQCILRLFAPLM